MKNVFKLYLMLSLGLFLSLNSMEQKGEWTEIPKGAGQKITLWNDTDHDVRLPGFKFQGLKLEDDKLEGARWYGSDKIPGDRMEISKYIDIYTTKPINLNIEEMVSGRIKAIPLVLDLNKYIQESGGRNINLYIKKGWTGYYIESSYSKYG